MLEATTQGREWTRQVHRRCYVWWG